MAVTDQRETPIRQKPLLVLVSGAPATGKTTLARHLADALALPLLARDTITNIVADAFGAPTQDQRDARIQASFAIYYGLLSALLPRRTSIAVSRSAISIPASHVPARCSSTARPRAR